MRFGIEFRMKRARELRAWRSTTRVQLLGAADAVIYGWSRAPDEVVRAR